MLPCNHGLTEISYYWILLQPYFQQDNMDSCPQTAQEDTFLLSCPTNTITCHRSLSKPLSLQSPSGVISTLVGVPAGRHAYLIKGVKPS